MSKPKFELDDLLPLLSFAVLALAFAVMAHVLRPAFSRPEEPAPTLEGYWLRQAPCAPDAPKATLYRAAPGPFVMFDEITTCADRARVAGEAVR